MQHPLTLTPKANGLVVTTLVVLIGLVLSGQAASPAAAATATEVEALSTFPASVTPTGEYADKGGEDPSISGEGRYVAFVSAADNLGEHGPAGVDEAYVKDLETGEVKLVSRAGRSSIGGTNGEPANEPSGGDGVEDVFISGDGRYVIFTSAASNLVTGLPPTGEPGEHPLHVYRRDLETGETVLVDRVTGPEGEILDERSPEAEAISAEGRYVLFRDHVEDLENPAGEHEPGVSTVYVRDLQTGTTTAVSRASGSGGEIANETSRAYSISPEGRYVAFRSSATNLVPGMEANTVEQVYLRDLQTNTTTLVSKTAPSGASPAGEPGDESSEEPILVGESGCDVAYESAATNLYSYKGNPVSTPQVYLTDVCAMPVSTTLVSRADGEDGAPAGEGNAVIPTPVGATANGQYVLFSALSELTGEVSPQTSTHLYLRDLATGQTTLIDRASGGNGALANNNPVGSAISANGCRVVFATKSTNLAEPSPPISQPIETYIRQLASCQPPAAEEHSEEEKSKETGAGGEQPIAATADGAGDQSTAIGATEPNAAASTSQAGLNPKCVVPTMRALDLTAVERALSAAHCALGHVAYHYNAIPKGGLVEQSLHQGTIRPVGTRIDIWLSRGRDLRYHRRGQFTTGAGDG
jgi:hypothetical protein